MRRVALSAGVRLASRRLRRARQNRPRLFFQASPGLLGFMLDTSPRQCVVAANRVGKTYQAIKKLTDRMLATPGLRCRIVGPTTKRVNRVHGRYLAGFLRGFLAPGSRWNPGTGFNNFNLAVASNGSTCELLSYEQDPAAHASDSMDIVLLDEPPPPAHFTEAESRVFDVGGQVWVTLTAVGRPVEWFREVVEAGIADRKAGRGPGWSFYQFGLSRQNCPWYTEEQILERIREVSRTPWEYAQRIDGAWDGVSEDRRFATFDTPNLLTLGVKLVDAWPAPQQRVHLALSVDHGEGPGHSHWILFGWQVVSPDNGSTANPELYVRAIAEWTNARRMSARRESAAVRDRLAEVGVQLDMLSWVVGDTNALAKSETAKTLNELFEIEFARLMGADSAAPRLRVRPARKGPDSVQGGIAVCNALFDSQAGAGPALQVSEACVGVVQSLRHWGGKDDELKHAADAFRYGVNEIAREERWSPVRLMAA